MANSLKCFWSRDSSACSKAFHKAIGRAAQAAETGRLVTFGITPDRAETGYGYIAGGQPIAGCEGACAVARFIEKPQEADAERYVAAGDYFWNSGIFLFPAAVYLGELERLRPDMLAGYDPLPRGTDKQPDASR